MRTLSIILVLSLALLAACGQEASTAPTQPAPSQPSAPTEPAPVQVEPSAPAEPSQPTPEPPKTEVGNCAVTAEQVKQHCMLALLPEQEDCVFLITPGASNAGGSVSVTVEPATEADYIKAYSAIYEGEETYELKPRATRREKAPNSFFFWWTGKDLITAKATTSACPTDRLKKLVVAAGANREE